MIEIHSNQVTPELHRMFEQDMPTVVRALAVLGGGNAGKIFTDNPFRPSWGLVQENDDGTLYLGGQVNRQVLGEAIAALRKSGVVCLAFREGNSNLELSPPDPDDTVDCIEFDLLPRQQDAPGWLRAARERNQDLGYIYLERKRDFSSRDGAY